jgi:hypothetical protein
MNDQSLSVADEGAFYSLPSPTSDLARHAANIDGWDATWDEAARVACNAVLHVAAVARLDVNLDEVRIGELDIRSAARIVDRVLELNPSPLPAERQPVERMIGNCHHISLLTCALLRHRGIPTRARAGFASYLDPGRWTDHWVCEVLQEGSWRRFDPDGSIDLSEPAGRRFLSGGEAWIACRAGNDDPNLFGFEDSRGWWFIRNNVVRDFAALCKVELLPWDWWGLMVGVDEDRPDALIDELASSCVDQAAWDERARRIQGDPRLNPGGKVFVFRGGQAEVELPAVW